MKLEMETRIISGEARPTLPSTLHVGEKEDEPLVEGEPVKQGLAKRLLKHAWSHIDPSRIEIRVRDLPPPDLPLPVPFMDAALNAKDAADAWRAGRRWGRNLGGRVAERVSPWMAAGPLLSGEAWLGYSLLDPAIPAVVRAAIGGIWALTSFGMAFVGAKAFAPILQRPMGAAIGGIIGGGVGTFLHLMDKTYRDTPPLYM